MQSRRGGGQVVVGRLQSGRRGREGKHSICRANALPDPTWVDPEDGSGQDGTETANEMKCYSPWSAPVRSCRSPASSRCRLCIRPSDSAPRPAPVAGGGGKEYKSVDELKETTCKKETYLLMSAPFGQLVNCSLLQLVHREQWSVSARWVEIITQSWAESWNYK